jgi:hypothetical protein
MLLGIVVLSVGIKKTVGHAFEPLHWGEAIALGGGVALYLLGHAAFLRLLGLAAAAPAGGRAVVLATIPLGHVWRSPSSPRSRSSWRRPRSSRTCRRYAAPAHGDQRLRPH